MKILSYNLASDLAADRDIEKTYVVFGGLKGYKKRAAKVMLSNSQRLLQRVDSFLNFIDLLLNLQKLK